jgi:small subunit ribosomal protein S17
MPKRVLQGVVVSDKQDKTVVVKVERRFTHPVLKKTVRRTKNYHAHDEGNVAKVGQTVQIQESRPYSKLKTWELVTEGAGENQGSGGIFGAIKSLVGLGGSDEKAGDKA